mmetsp:Transcript_9599/g.23773  ORF Transcript_9599/g.23773 Transcript_9599/m.23773 type:complete len:214 (-) Transcript_9599:699-1340(-)
MRTWQQHIRRRWCLTARRRRPRFSRVLLQVFQGGCCIRLHSANPLALEFEEGREGACFDECMRSLRTCDGLSQHCCRALKHCLTFTVRCQFHQQLKPSKLDKPDSVALIVVDNVPQGPRGTLEHTFAARSLAKVNQGVQSARLGDLDPIHVIVVGQIPQGGSGAFEHCIICGVRAEPHQWLDPRKLCDPLPVGLVVRKIGQSSGGALQNRVID